MSDTNIYSLIQDVQSNGIRVVTLIGIYTLYSKERRNHQLNQRDAALFHNLKILMEERGLGDQWKDGPRIGIQIDRLPNFKQLLILLSKATFQNKLSYPRRKKKMKLLLTSPWSKKLFAFLLLVIVNGLNDTLGLHLTPDTISRVTTLGGTYIIAQASVDTIKPLLMMFIGSFTNKTGVDAVVDTQPSNTIGINK